MKKKYISPAIEIITSINFELLAGSEKRKVDGEGPTGSVIDDGTITDPDDEPEPQAKEFNIWGDE